MVRMISRRGLFAAAAAGFAAPTMANGATVTAQTPPPARAAALPDVWGQDFLNQWSPPANVKRELTPGKSQLRLSAQVNPRLTAETSSVDKNNFATVVVHRSIDRVAGRSGFVVDDKALFAKQAIDE